MTREEDIGHTLALVLERTRAIWISGLRVHQLLTELIPDATVKECDTELDLLIQKNFVESRTDSLGGTMSFRLSAEGILARRRKEI